MTTDAAAGLQSTDATAIRNLITEFGRIEPLATELSELGFFVFNHAPVMLFDGLRRALSQVSVTERVLLARFVVAYADPVAAAGGDPGFVACTDLLAKANDILTMLGLTELAVSSLKVTDLDEIERIGNQMSAGKPQEIGLWLAYVAARDLTRSFGYRHYFIQLALAVYGNRDGPDFETRRPDFHPGRNY